MKEMVPDEAERYLVADGDGEMRTLWPASPRNRVEFNLSLG